ncbi:MAG: glycosyltransferase family 4 protein [Bacteroidota bacterium]
MKVVVSQPNKQYCNDLLLALHQHGYLEQFYTLFASNKNTFAQKLLPNRFKGELRKRNFPGIPADRISHFPDLLVYHKLFTSDIESKIKKSFKRFDQAVAGAISKVDYDIALSYENANLHTFQAAKQQGKITVLDLAQVHHNTIADINDIVPLEKGLTREKMRYMNALKDEALAYTDYVLTLSSFARDTMMEQGVAPERLYTANLGINPELFTSKKAWNQNQKIQFLFVGTMTYRKGLDILLRAFHELHLPNVELILVGPMADAADQMQQYEGSYTYIPFLHHEALVHYYQQADVFIFPSYLDSWAQTVVEAMACGTPAIVTEHTGAKDAVQQGGGFVIPINDVAALKEKILYFVEQPKEIERIGRAATKIAQQYTWVNYHRKIVAIMEEINARRTSDY